MQVTETSTLPGSLTTITETAPGVSNTVTVRILHFAQYSSAKY